MKKLLIFMLVLGMTSAASAAVVLSIDGDTAVSEINIAVTDTFTLGLVSDAPTTGFVSMYFALIAPASLVDGSLGSPVDETGEMMFSVIAPWSDATLGDGYAMTPATMTSIAAGTWYKMTYTHAANYPVAITLYGDTGVGAPDAGNVIDTVTVIPEPMTIALLGFGGLFLLRRRK